MRKTTICLAALSLLLTGFVIAQVTSAKAVPQSENPFRIFTTTDGKIVQPKPKAAPPIPIQFADDVAIRIEGTHDGMVLGTLVARVDGKWVDVQLASKNMRLTNTLQHKR